VVFVKVLRRAKSLEVFVSEEHLAGWDFLITHGEDLAERGFAQATLQDFHDFVVR
jgi:hypothetical protein